MPIRTAFWARTRRRLAGVRGVVIRALAANAARVECVLDDGRAVPLDRDAEGLSDLYSVFLPGATLPLSYHFRMTYVDGTTWERGDPYRFLPTLGDVDLHLFNEGTHRRLWKKLGAHVRVIDGVAGVSFAVWAPNARRVSVVGEFCAWDGRVFPDAHARRVGRVGAVHSRIEPGALYKFEMLTREGAIASQDGSVRVQDGAAAGHGRRSSQSEDSYAWGDETWIDARRVADPVRAPMSIYEVHLGSWARVPEDGESVADVSRDRAATRRARRTARLHARRVAAGDGASVLRLVGLSGQRLLRADVALRHARRFSLSRRPTCISTASA